MSTTRRALLAVSGLSLLACLPLIWICRDGILAPGPSVCAYRLITAHDCIFCGLTRAVASAELGHWRAAFAYHPLWPLALIAVCALALTCLLDAYTDGTRAGTCMHWFRRNAARIALALLVLSLVRGAWLPSHGVDLH